MSTGDIQARNPDPTGQPDPAMGDVTLGSRTTLLPRTSPRSRSLSIKGQMVADVAPQTQQAWDLAASSGNVGQDQYGASQAGF